MYVLASSYVAGQESGHNLDIVAKSEDRDELARYVERQITNLQKKRGIDMVRVWKHPQLDHWEIEDEDYGDIYSYIMYPLDNLPDPDEADDEIE